MTFQVCDVNGPLGAVRQMTKHGSRVVFDDGGSYIEDKKTGVQTKIHDKQGAYIMKLKARRNLEEKNTQKGF